MIGIKLKVNFEKLNELKVLYNYTHDPKKVGSPPFLLTASG